MLRNSTGWEMSCCSKCIRKSQTLELGEPAVHLLHRFVQLRHGSKHCHLCQVKTVTCKLPRTMLPVVVGEDGKIVTDIARDAKVKVTLVKGGPHEESALFHLVGTAEAVKTAQYMMQIKIKERLAKGEGGIRYNR